MSGILSEIIRNAKKQKNMIHNIVKNQSLEINPEIEQIVELVVKQLKIIITIFQMLKKEKIEQQSHGRDEDPN